MTITHPVILRLVKRNKKQVVVDALKEFDPDIESIEALPDGLYLAMKGLHELLPHSMAGDGVRRMINIMAHYRPARITTLS